MTVAASPLTVALTTDELAALVRALMDVSTDDDFHLMLAVEKLEDLHYSQLAEQYVAMPGEKPPNG